MLAILGRLHHRPPKVLLVEGDGPESRAELALHWAQVLNCTAAEKPCQTCTACRRIADRECLDLKYMDGREEKIGIDAVRELISLFGQAPRDGGRRVIVLGEAQEMTQEAANALLKSMEDTDQRNYFVLLVPQRERLLPTLVSRSWVVNLGWSAQRDAALADTVEAEGEDDLRMNEWGSALLTFLRTGQGWFAKTMVKSQVDKPLVAGLVGLCRGRLIQAMRRLPDDEWSRYFFERGNPEVWRAVDLRLQQAEQALTAKIAPALVLDWLVVGMRMALNRASDH